MKFIIIVAIVTGIYVCAMDVVNKFTNSLDFSKEASIVTVSIEGEVVSPGVYNLPYGATLKDLVYYAGGFTEAADYSKLSASEILSNSQNYFIPSKVSEEQIIQISINKASLKELEAIPGVGPSLAARIVAYRLENGEFTALEDLCNVKGIKDATLEKMLPYIKL